MRIHTFKYILVFFYLIIIAEKPAKCQDTLQVFNDTVSLVAKHSPSKAAFLSAVLPGLGQIYNHKGLFWRLPLLYAGIAAETYVLIYMNNKYSDFHTGYINYTTYVNGLHGNYSLYDPAHVVSMLSGLGIGINNSTVGNSTYIPYLTSTLKVNNDNFKQWRDMNILIMAGIYFLNVIDATVTAYFFDYDISDNISMRVRPTLINNSISNIGTFGMKLTFNLH